MAQTVPNWSNTEEPGKRRFAYFRSVVEHKGLDPAVKKHFLREVEKLRAEGHSVEEVEFEYLEQLVPVYYLLTTAEASSNLARYDGARYGFRAENANDPESVYKLSRTQGFGKEVKRRIILGTFVLSAGYYDAFFGKAQKARRLVSERTQAILEDFDFILSPTSPHEAFPLGEINPDPTVMYLEDIFTVLANITGNPAISIPSGKGEAGLPLGIQLLGRNLDEKSLFDMAHNWPGD
jgi:aspartyl-tRNA(Asn)/glutamyl-tRNA(Gln) amidotransferase subunit A